MQLVPKDPFYDFTAEESSSESDEQCIFDYPPKLVIKKIPCQHYIIKINYRRWKAMSSVKHFQIKFQIFGKLSMFMPKFTFCNHQNVEILPFSHF